MNEMTDEEFLDHLEALDRPYTKEEQERIFAMTGGPRIGGPTYNNLYAETRE
jgi:hypothetical protein